MDNINRIPSDNYQHVIIGGTIKAATTSLFNYISAHPQVCGSSVKETYYFSHRYTGNPDADYKQYASFFSPKADTRVVLEASPNYLAPKENIAPRIKQLLPDAKLLFVLRDPVDRLYSHFNFAKGKLELPEAMTFEKYIEMCELFNAGKITPSEAGIAVKHLRALEIGNYASYLQKFYDIFDTNNIKVIFFDELNKEPLKILAEICEFVGVNPLFYKEYILNKANVTFSARMKLIHYYAVSLNRLLESVLRQRPGLKQRLVKIYKYFNLRREGYDPMLESTRKKLVHYYAPSNSKVQDILKDQPLSSWLYIR